MCSEMDNDRKTSKFILWTQQNKLSKGKHMGHAKERAVFVCATAQIVTPATCRGASVW